MSTKLVKSERQTGIAYVLWLAGFFGFCGLHRLYAGRWVSGLIWLFTLGLCSVGQIIDVFFVPRMIEDVNAGREVW